MEGPFISYAFFGHGAVKSLRGSLRGLRHDLFYFLLANRRKIPLLSLGEKTNHFEWTICPTNLGADSVVISAGAGRDVSFELELIKRFGCKVVLLDPSPTGIATMALAKNQHPRLQFIQAALVGKDGPVSFFEPSQSEEGSFSSVAGAGVGHKVEGISLVTLMKKYRWSKIDLLKIDIEGAEYEVIRSILKNKIKALQICVEFHNNVLPGIPTSWTVNSLLRLWNRGWRVIHKSGSNHTLWNQSMIQGR